VEKAKENAAKHDKNLAKSNRRNSSINVGRLRAESGGLHRALSFFADVQQE